MVFEGKLTLSAANVSPNGESFQLTSTIFGDRKDFAIEVLSEPHLAPPSAVWGRMCLHIGDLSLATSPTSIARCILRTGILSR